MNERGRKNGFEGLDADDLVLPFETVRSRVKGRFVRLTGVVDTILSRHAYPDVVRETLGKAIALVALLGAPLLPGSHLGLQTRTDGVIRFILADYEASGRLRGYASFDAEKLAHLDNGGKPPQQSVLIGKGHLALTLANGIEEDRYQASWNSTIIAFTLLLPPVGPAADLRPPRHCASPFGVGRSRVALACRRLHDPASVGVCRSRRHPRCQRGGLGLAARAHTGGNRRGSRTARSDAAARSPAARGRRCRLQASARQCSLPLFARTRVDVSDALFGCGLRRSEGPGRRHLRHLRVLQNRLSLPRRM